MIDGEWRNSPIECAEDSTRRMALQLTYRQRRWLDALIILGTIATAFVVVGFVGTLFFSFGDIVLVFFLAWLLAFILSPIVSALVRKIPRLPRNLMHATENLKRSKPARELFGETFVDHFVRTREWEWRQFQDAVTDWETKRYFEII